MASPPAPPAAPRRIGTSLAEINIIPLVDVVLVLLLIFMLTAPMMYRGIDVNLPKASAKPTAVEERMVLTLTRHHSLFLNDKRVGSGALVPEEQRVVPGQPDDHALLDRGPPG